MSIQGLIRFVLGRNSVSGEVSNALSGSTVLVKKHLRQGVRHVVNSGCRTRISLGLRLPYSKFRLGLRKHTSKVLLRSRGAVVSRVGNIIHSLSQIRRPIPIRLTRTGYCTCVCTERRKLGRVDIRVACYGLSARSIGEFQRRCAFRRLRG